MTEEQVKQWNAEDGNRLSGDRVVGCIACYGEFPLSEFSLRAVPCSEHGEHLVVKCPKCGVEVRGMNRDSCHVSLEYRYKVQGDPLGGPVPVGKYTPPGLNLPPGKITNGDIVAAQIAKMMERPGVAEAMRGLYGFSDPLE